MQNGALRDLDPGHWEQRPWVHILYTYAKYKYSNPETDDHACERLRRREEKSALKPASWFSGSYTIGQRQSYRRRSEIHLWYQFFPN